MAEIVRGNAAFTNNLYQILAKKSGNVFFSPIGIHICLSMIHQGAEGETADVLSKILKLPDPEATAKAYKAIINKLNSAEKVTLLMANKIYAKENKANPVVFIEDFKNCMTEYFYGDLEFVDFDKKQEAAKRINTWIQDKTQGKILNMISEEDIDEETAMFLINALYFKGLWSKKFHESSTNNQLFYIDDSNSVEVKMMHNTSDYLFKTDQELEAKILRLPYEGGKISMAIVLPFEKNGIEKLENKLAGKDLTQLTQNMTEHEVVLSLPKFKVEETIHLKPVLTEMGLENIFDKVKANFRKIIELSSQENLHVDKVIQKSFIEVNEEGTEAAAVTVVKMRRIPKCKVVHNYEYFEVDHPAIFMLIADFEGEMNILFCGRLSRPIQ